MKLARVFPRRTRATPDDDLAFFGPPSMFVEADEVHVDVTFTADLDKAEQLAEDWRRVAPVKIGGVAHKDPGQEFILGRYVKHPHYEITANGKMVWLAHVLCYSDAHAGTEYEANAHLIASAPDLYAALEYTKAQISLPKPVLEKIEAALLKARGIEKEYRGSLHSGWQW